MARPQKQTIDYFPHMCNTESGKTLSVLQNKYGNDGFALWFRLLEFLGKRDGLYFDYSNPADLEFLCAKTHQKDTETLLHMLADLDILGAIDHELYLEKVIWCQNFVDGVADAFARSVAGVPQRPTPKTVNVEKPNQSVVKKGVSVDNNPNTDTETPQTKGKEIKVNKSKVETTTPLPPSPESLLSSTTQEEVIEKNAFTLFAEEIGKLTPFTSSALNDALEHYPEDWVKDAIKEAALANKRDWRYVEGILKNWARNGRDVKSKKFSGNFGAGGVQNRDPKKLEKNRPGLRTYNTIEQIQAELKKKAVNK